MMEYMEAYRQRMVRNHNTFLGLAGELKAKGCKVLASDREEIGFIKAIKDGRHVSLAFEEVPYCWSLGIDFKPSKAHGSGRTLESRCIDENPFTAEYMIGKMLPNPDMKDFEKPFWMREL